jgi:hypothetical protein
MKSLNICAGNNEKRIARTSEISLRYSSIVDTPEIAYRNRGLAPFTLTHHSLRAKKYFGCAIRTRAVGMIVNERLGRHDQFQAGRD